MEIPAWVGIVVEAFGAAKRGWHVVGGQLQGLSREFLLGAVHAAACGLNMKGAAAPFKLPRGGNSALVHFPGSALPNAGKGMRWRVVCVGS